jgi:hypothetical protein
MYPHERSLVEQYAGRPFVIIGVNSDREENGGLEKVKELMADGTVTWRSFSNFAGPQAPISEKWSVQGWPTVYLIDAQGIIRYKANSAPPAALIESLVNEAAGTL